MEVNEAREIIKAQGWTPRIVPRRNGLQYLYAAKWNKPKTDWRYIGPISKLGEMTEETIVARIHKTKTA